MTSQKKPTTFFGLIVIGICLLAVAALVAKVFFIGNYYIPHNGMYPTLPAGSHLLTSKRAYSKPSDVKRGDIVVFFREEDGISLFHVQL